MDDMDRGKLGMLIAIVVFFIVQYSHKEAETMKLILKEYEEKLNQDTIDCEMNKEMLQTYEKRYKELVRSVFEATKFHEIKPGVQSRTIVLELSSEELDRIGGTIDDKQFSSIEDLDSIISLILSELGKEPQNREPIEKNKMSRNLPCFSDFTSSGWLCTKIQNYIDNFNLFDILSVIIVLGYVIFKNVLICTKYIFHTGKFIYDKILTNSTVMNVVGNVVNSHFRGRQNTENHPRTDHSNHETTATLARTVELLVKEKHGKKSTKVVRLKSSKTGNSTATNINTTGNEPHFQDQASTSQTSDIEILENIETEESGNCDLDSE